ncbi:MAG: GAF domain-containing protein [Nitrospirota bacterium]|nr:GAF domain-containing protein [Nitrospirota bacterium]
MSATPTFAETAVRKLEEAFSRHRTRLAELHYALDCIADSVLELPARLNAVTQVIRLKLGCDVCSVYLLDAENEWLVLEASSGLAPEAVGHARLRLGEGVTGWVAEHMEAVALADAHDDPRFKYLPETHEERFRSLLSVPVVADRSFVGVINVQHRSVHPFSEYERLLVGAVGYKVGAMVRAALLEQRTARQEAAIDVLLWAGARDAAPTGDFLPHLLARSRRALFATGAVLRRWQPDSGRLEVVCAAGGDLADQGLSPLAPGEGIAGTVLASGEGVCINDYRTLASSLKAVPAVSSSVLCVPVWMATATGGNRIVGTLSFLDKSAPHGPGHFDPADRKLAEGLARVAAPHLMADPAGLMDAPYTPTEPVSAPTSATA